MTKYEQADFREPFEATEDISTDYHEEETVNLI